MKARSLLGFLLPIPLVIAMVFEGAAQAPPGPQGPGSESYVPGEVLIRFKEGVGPSDQSALLDQLDVIQQRHLTPYINLLKLGSPMTVAAAIEHCRDNPLIEYVEPNYILEMDAVPNDPFFSSLYGLDNTGQTGGTPGADISAVQAWDVSTGGLEVVVAIIDTGIDYTHTDLAENIWSNPGEIEGNGIDDDGNGFIDDVRGWDFANDDNDPLDDAGHGTHVAGTVGAVGDNSIGVVGVNWKVSLLPIKFLGSGGTGTTADAILSVIYAILVEADVINASWGGGAFSQALLDSINDAAEADILFVASAGNFGTDTDIFPHFPSGYDAPSIISVAATDDDDQKASFSNFGQVTVDLGAPGVRVPSTLPGNSLGFSSGTSMSAPHVSGTAALIRHIVPNLGFLEIKNLILDNVDPVPSLSGITVTGGRLNAFTPIAVQDTTPPGVITDVQVVQPTSNTVILRFTATGDDGAVGTASRYDVRYSDAPIDELNFLAATGAVGLPVPKASALEENIEVFGLGALMTYYIAVKAQDEWGNAGPISNIVSTTTLSPPTVVSSPASFDLVLFTGQQAAETLNIQNVGSGSLDWSISTPLVVTEPAVPEQLESPWTLDKDDEDPRSGDPVTQPFGGPDSAGYSFITSDAPAGPLFTWNNIALHGTLILILRGDDQVSEPISLGFQFPFYGEQYDSVRVSTNGWLSFGSPNLEFTNQPLPSIAAPVTLVAPFWDDLDFRGAYRAVYVGDEESFTVQFIDVPRHNGSGTYTFQVTLERTGRIRFHYLSMSGETSSATVGVQSGSAGLQVAFNTEFVHDGLTVEINGVPQWITASPTEGRLFAGEEQNVDLSIDALGLAPGVYETSIEVMTNDPLHSSVRHPFTLEALGAPAIVVEPTTLDFGSIIVGNTAILSLEVRNAGTEVLAVSDILGGDPPVTLTPTSFALQQDASQTIDVQYAPTAVAQLDSALTIVSDAPNAPMLEVALLGAGVPPPTIEIDPNSTSETLLTGQTSTRVIQIHNTGGSDLLVQLNFDPPSSGSIALTNGGFETGNFSEWSATSNGRPGLTDWTVASAGLGFFGNSSPFEGSFDALNGFDGRAGLMYRLTRDIDVPFGRPELNYRDRIQFDSRGIPSSLPRTYVASLEDLAGNTLVEFVREDIFLDGAPPTDLGWQLRTVNLSPFGGQTVRLVIHETIPESFTGPANIEFDDFKIVGSTFPTWVTPAVGAAAVPAGEVFDLELMFDAGMSPSAMFQGTLVVHTNVPATPIVLVPVDLTVIGAPDIALAGEEIRLKSVQTYRTGGAMTTHSLTIDGMPAGDGALELIVEGDYGDPGESATMTAESLTVGTVGEVGTDCEPTSGAFPITAADLASLVSDGVVEVEVQNTPDVNFFCPVDRHTVLLTYRLPSSQIDFGQLFVGQIDELDLLVRNNGTAVLELTSISTGTPEFSFSIGSTSVAPGGSETLTVSFAPTTNGSFSDTLSVSSNDPDTPLVQVPLLGEAVPQFEIQQAKTKCGRKGKDYIRIGGRVEEFSISRDLIVSITSNPSIFGPVEVTIPPENFVIEAGKLNATVPIQNGQVEVSFPESGTGSFQINVDANGLNQCPESVAMAALILRLDDGEDAIALEQTTTSKFHSVSDCSISLEGIAPTMISFFSFDDWLIGAPSSYSMVTGLLSDLKTSGDFAQATCLGTFTGVPMIESLPDPPVGNARYYLVEGVSSCVAAGFGDSTLDPDPRNALDLASRCP